MNCVVCGINCKTHVCSKCKDKGLCDSYSPALHKTGKYGTLIGIVCVVVYALILNNMDYTTPLYDSIYPLIFLILLIAGAMAMLWVYEAKEITEARNKLADITNKTDLDNMAKRMGSNSFNRTVGNNVFAIDTLNNLWKANYMRNMQEYTILGKISNIIGYSIEPVYYEKSNTMGRAITGGILFGPVGAIVGAMTSKAQIIDTEYCYLTISTNYQDYGTQEYQMDTFTGKSIIETLDIYFAKARATNEKEINIKIPINPPIVDLGKQGTNTSKKLQDLKILFEQNLITSEEYDMKRKEIIDNF